MLMDGCTLAFCQWSCVPEQRSELQTTSIDGRMKTVWALGLFYRRTFMKSLGSTSWCPNTGHIKHRFSRIYIDPNGGLISNLAVKWCLRCLNWNGQCQVHIYLKYNHALFRVLLACIQQRGTRGALIPQRRPANTQILSAFSASAVPSKQGSASSLCLGYCSNQRSLCAEWFFVSTRLKVSEGHLPEKVWTTCKWPYSLTLSTG